MAKKQTAMQRAERWYNKQVKNKALRDADYSALTRRMALCYEPSIMLNARSAQTNHDILQKAKELKHITEFKL